MCICVYAIRNQCPDSRTQTVSVYPHPPTYTHTHTHTHTHNAINAKCTQRTGGVKGTKVDGKVGRVEAPERLEQPELPRLGVAAVSWCFVCGGFVFRFLGGSVVAQRLLCVMHACVRAYILGPDSTSNTACRKHHSSAPAFETNAPVRQHCLLPLPAGLARHHVQPAGVRGADHEEGAVEVLLMCWKG